jgi:hypothetical protein
MKHILNNLSSQEKNRILEQHSGGKTIDTSNFKRLLESKLGNVKPLINEMETGVAATTNAAAVTATKISGNGQSLLDNASETYNTSIGVKTLPGCFSKTMYPGSMNFDQIGVSDSEVTDIVNLMDWPMDSSDAQQVLQWAQGNGMTASLGGNYNEFGSIKDRVVQINGKWYPAIEQLRVDYNKDEYFETLGSITKKDLLKDVRSNFVNAYKYWVDCVNSGK